MKTFGVALFVLIAAACALLLAPAAVLVDERHALAEYALRLGAASAAATLLRPLAEADDARALNNLGALHVHGAGVARDLSAARRLFVAAAERGSPRGRLNRVMLSNGGCGRNVRGSATAAAELQALARNGDATAASLIQDCLYFAATADALPDRDERFVEAGDRILRTNDPGALLHSGWALLNLARTTKVPDHDNPAEEAQYERTVIPIARKAMEVLFAATDAGATGAYEPLGILAMQFGERLGNDALAVRLRDKSNWEWLEEGAAKGDWEAQCRVAHARLISLRWDGRDYSRAELDTAVANARACIDRKETARAPTWHDAPEWLAVVVRRTDRARPVDEIRSTEAALNGLLFFDADRRLGAQRATSTRAPAIVVRGAP